MKLKPETGTADGNVCCSNRYAVPYHGVMRQDELSVTLSLGPAPYQQTLVSSLQRAGILRRVFDMRAGLQVLEPNGADGLNMIERFPTTQFSIRVVWAIWRRLPKSIRPRPPAPFNVWLHDKLMSMRLPPSTIFHSCTATCLACIKAAKRHGTITLVESASRHPRHWAQTEAEESSRFGIDTRDGSGNLGVGLRRRQEEEYQLCDRILVPSTVAKHSYAEFGYGDKTKVVPTGVDADFFTPGKAQAQQEIFRACYVGRVELSKGLGYLLQAWKKLSLPKAELVLVGAVNDHMQPLLREHADRSVIATGYLSPHELRRYYQNSDAFVFASPNEGLAQVLLEAMASGLPVVTTDMSGANDCVTNGKEGIIVQARNVDQLAEAILWCYEHRQEARAMGAAARAKIESQFTLEHYNQRVIALYRSLALSR